MIIPCQQNEELRHKIRQFAEVLKVEAYKLGDHGLTEQEFYNSGVFRGAIERIRGQFSATMRDKREFVQHVLDSLRDRGFIEDWQSAGEANRHDYTVDLNSGRVAVIELKGCLDGNNTNIFERPPQASEFIVWSVCTNPGADPRHNAWSGIHTRLSAEIISREQRVDGVVIWDMVCATIGRPCPKVVNRPERVHDRWPLCATPPCIYVLPPTIPSPRNNPAPKAQTLEEVELLKVLHQAFAGHESEVHYVDFEVQYRGVDLVRTTRVRRAGVDQRCSDPTAIRRS